MSEKQTSQELDVVQDDNQPIPPRADKDRPGDEERIQPPKDEESFPAVSFLSLFRLHTPFEITLNLLALVAAAAAGAAQPLMSLLFGNLTQSFIQFGADLAQGEDVAAAGERFKALAAQDALYILVIGIGMGLATWAFMAVWTYTGEVNAKRLRERYLQAVLRQEIAYFDNIRAGEVATRIQSDTHLVQQGTSEKVGMAVEQLSSFVTGFVVAYVRSWRLALALTTILPCIVITGTVMTILMSRWIQASLGFIAEGGTLAEEVISSVHTAQAFGSQQVLAKLYNTKNAKATRIDLRTTIVNGIGLGCFYFIVYAAYGLAFYFGTTLILDGTATVGIVVNVFMSILTGSYALVLLGPEQQAVAQAQGAAAKIYATIDRVPAIDARSPADVVRGHVALENVVFRYPSRPGVPVLKGLSLEFEAGKTTALVGASGSGKSTIVALIERFYDPLGGADLKDLNVMWLRAQIGLVAQEPTLFATSIRGNVAHGLVGSRFEGAGEEERERRVREACVTANVHAFIVGLPRGYDTLVGERGFLLSGGQKQRIAIARAIMSDPRILLLDEATSALDTQSEGVMQDALDRAAAGRTTITVAHRLSTVRNADRIYVMGAGAVLEHGTHNALLARANGPYARLIAAHAPVAPEVVQEGAPP